MKTRFAIAALVAGLFFAPVAASAGDSVTNGLLGAGAGALVGGPVGAVVGGAVGYTQGSRIDRALPGNSGHRVGFRSRQYHRHASYGRRRHYR